MTIESIPVLMSTKHEFHNCAADELRSNDSGSATLEASTAILLSGSIGTVVAIGSQTKQRFVRSIKTLAGYQCKINNEGPLWPRVICVHNSIGTT